VHPRITPDLPAIDTLRSGGSRWPAVDAIGGDAFNPATVRSTGAGDGAPATGRSPSVRATNAVSGTPRQAEVPVRIDGSLAALAGAVGLASDQASLADLGPAVAAIVRLAVRSDLAHLVAIAGRNPDAARALFELLSPGIRSAAARGFSQVASASGGGIPGGRSTPGGAGITAAAAAPRSAAVPSTGPGVVGGAGALVQEDAELRALARCVLRFVARVADEPTGGMDEPEGQTATEVLSGAPGARPGHPTTGNGPVGLDAAQRALDLVRRAMRDGSGPPPTEADGGHASDRVPSGEPRPPAGTTAGSGRGMSGPADGGVAIPTTAFARGDAAPGFAGIVGAPSSAGAASTAGASGQAGAPLAAPGGAPGETGARGSPAIPSATVELLRSIVGDTGGDLAGRLVTLLDNLSRFDPSLTAAQMTARASADPLVADALRRLLAPGGAQPDLSLAGSRAGIHGAAEPTHEPIGSPPDGGRSLDDATLATDMGRALGIGLADRDPRLLVPLLGILASLSGLADARALVERARRDRRTRRRLRRSLAGGSGDMTESAELSDTLGSATSPAATGRSASRRLRIWNAACGEGIDAVGLAIAAMERGVSEPPLILATDVDAELVGDARRGRFASEAAAALPPEIRRRYFVDRGEDVEVVPDLRRVITFRRHDVASRPIGEPFDVVVCRGLLWALSSEPRARAIRHLVAGVRPGGMLVLGPGDPALDASDGVRQLGRGRYVRVAGAGRAVDVQA
jgi:chemotaxis protein methyltransferase CheR